MKIAMKHKTNESGLVSLVVCMIIMVIIALITISFASIARREQRQALDSQLSSQAFFAAESGVNDAVQVTTRLANPILDVASCDSAQQDLINPTRVLDAAAGVAYTCVLIDSSPTEIVDSVSTVTSSVYPVDAPGITRIRIYWEDDPIPSLKTQAPFTNLAGQTFSPLGVWSPVWDPVESLDKFKTGLLRIELIPADFAAGVSRASVAAGTIDYIASPYDTSNGRVLHGNCITTPVPPDPRQCYVDIAVVGRYYLKLIAIYDPVKVTVQAFNAANTQLELVKAQTVIDSTGKSGDVTRRIKIYRPFLPSKLTPDYTLQISGDLCKRLQTEPTLTTTDLTTIEACKPDTLFP